MEIADITKTNCHPLIEWGGWDSLYPFALGLSLAMSLASLVCLGWFLVLKYGY